jgi:hypothetical protein
MCVRHVGYEPAIPELYGDRGDVVAWRGELLRAHERHGLLQQMHMIVAESRDRAWNRPAIAAWSPRMEPWVGKEWRFYLEPAIVETR